MLIVHLRCEVTTLVTGALGSLPRVACAGIVDLAMGVLVTFESTAMLLQREDFPAALRALKKLAKASSGSFGDAAAVARAKDVQTRSGWASVSSGAKIRYGYLTLPLVVDAPQSLWAHYAWDMFHENPVASIDALAGKRVLAFSVEIASGLDELAASLSAAVGVAPRPLAIGYVLDHWVLRPDGRGGGVVAHYDELPDFAVAPPAPARRSEVLRALFSLVSRAGDRDALARATAIPTDGSGVIIAGAGALDVSLAPAILAIDLAALLGWRNIASRCYDTHQRDWSIHHLTQDADGDVVAVVPCVGAWPVRARLDRRPTGGAVSTPNPPPLGGIHLLGPTDVVRRIAIAGPT